MTIEDIARICHEANRIYCQSIGDDSQLHWEASPQWQRDSAIKGVQFRIERPPKPILSGGMEFDLCGFGKEKISQHDSWMKDKLLDGWKYGLVKDADKKEHPCLLPYEYLPEEQKTKDALFCSIVDTLKRFIL